MQSLHLILSHLKPSQAEIQTLVDSLAYPGELPLGRKPSMGRVDCIPEGGFTA